MAARSKSTAAALKTRVKLFQQPSQTKEMGKNPDRIQNLDGLVISSSNAKRIERELKVLTQMVRTVCRLRWCCSTTT